MLDGGGVPPDEVVDGRLGHWLEARDVAHRGHADELRRDEAGAKLDVLAVEDERHFRHQHVAGQLQHRSIGVVAGDRGAHKRAEHLVVGIPGAAERP